MSLIKNSIIVADDFGISKKVDQAIIEQAEKGLIDVVSILPNFVDRRSIKQLKNIRVKFAAHFNLIEGKPVSDPNLISTVIDRHGNFFKLPRFLFLLYSNKLDLKEIEIELNNQLKRLNGLGIKIDHINSHQHVLVLPKLGSIVRKLIIKNKIRNFRTFNSIKINLIKKPWKYLVLSMLVNADKIIFGNGPVINIGTLKETIIHPGTNYDRRII